MQTILRHDPEICNFATLWLAGQSDDLCRAVLTRCNCLEFLLHFCDNSFDLWWRSSPEHKAMSRILETRFNRLVFQLCEDSIDSYTCKVGRGELLLLLCTPIATMGLVTSLDLGLYMIRPDSKEESIKSLQSYRGMLRSDRCMGCLIL